jgi:protein-S-isoprenylcysteine O-methyltransferase Ste14
MTERNDRGESWVLAQALLFIGYVLLPVWPRPAAALDVHAMLLGVKLLGGAIASVGLALTIWAVAALRHSLTPLPKPRADSRLEQQGPYRFVRHPMYGGVILLMLGIALARLSVSHLLLTALCCWFFDRKARVEENWLRARYPEYAAYAARVKKLLPGIY